MAKYDPLNAYFAGLSTNVTEKTLNFDQIERIIGARLPRSAHVYREWWANEAPPTSHVQALAWMEAGWHVDAVNQDEGWVRFRRVQTGNG